MKKFTSAVLILSGLFLILSVAVHATVLTVSNSPASGGQYTTINAAISAASVDDTVYVNGSAFTYAATTINKRITLIGAGYSPTGTQYNMGTSISSITLDSVLFTNPVFGTHIIGVDVNGVSSFYRFSDIHIERCRIGNLNAPGDGWIIENNIITGAVNVYNSSCAVNNMIIRNNFLLGGISSGCVTAAAGLLVDHNIIGQHIDYTNYALITNNIFFYANITGSYLNSYNIYNNNITINLSPDVLPFGANSGTGNYNNITASTVFSNGLTSATNYPALLNYDWHVIVSSQGHNGATDGTDIGLYGGTMVMPNLTGASTLPQIYLFDISNSSIPLNGTLNYEFKARKQD